MKGRLNGTDRLLERAFRESSSDILMQLITHKDGGGLFWGLDHRPWAKEAGAAWRFGQQAGAGPA